MSAEPGGPRPEVAGFPDDLVALQQRWTRIFNRLAGDPPADGHGLRMELLGLSFRLDARPHWVATEAGWSRAARRALQKYASAAPGGEEELVTLCVDGRIIAVPPDEVASLRRRE
ncbi:hypothetical protein ACFCYI_03970 [Streptomyces sp. NPDC056257]|uniref:hypothetical protein n=1 Tax=Streptomyces sp. NPDC056257 TaxID=3345765 RepID=UPI0035D5D7E9